MKILITKEKRLSSRIIVNWWYWYWLSVNLICYSENLFFTLYWRILLEIFYIRALYINL